MEKTEAIECADAHCGVCTPVDAIQAPETDRVAAKAGSTVFRIRTMDCAVEESEIRRALEPVAAAISAH